MAHDLAELPGLPAATLLHLWEAGVSQPPLQRCLAILAAAEPGRSRQEWASLPVGRRDAHLLALYARTFGSRLPGQAYCAHCGEAAEFDLDVRNLLALSPGAEGSTPLAVAGDGYTVTHRLPTSMDLEAIAGIADAAEARRRLLQRCIVAAAGPDGPVAAEQLPATLLAAVSTQMAAHDPLAVVDLALTCPVCAGEWHVVLDIAVFLWCMLEAQAARLLREVAALARAYGWREADILALNPIRRQAYLELQSL